MNNFEALTYPNFADLRIHNNEPLNHAFLNAHIIKMVSNLESMNNLNTIQKASYEQWGVVKKATIDDILNRTDEDTVVTNKTLNDALLKLREDSVKNIYYNKTISLSKHYKFYIGSFTVGENENIAKRITTNPENVVFTHIDILPYGFDSIPFYTTNKHKLESDKIDESSGIINFTSWRKPSDYKGFNIYYHKDGYIVCRNNKITSKHKQILVNWYQLIRV